MLWSLGFGAMPTRRPYVNEIDHKILKRKLAILRVKSLDSEQSKHEKLSEIQLAREIGVLRAESEFYRDYFRFSEHFVEVIKDLYQQFLLINCHQYTVNPYEEKKMYHQTWEDNDKLIGWLGEAIEWHFAARRLAESELLKLLGVENDAHLSQF